MTSFICVAQGTMAVFDLNPWQSIIRGADSQSKIPQQEALKKV